MNDNPYTCPTCGIKRVIRGLDLSAVDDLSKALHLGLWCPVCDLGPLGRERARKRDLERLGKCTTAK